MEITSFGITFTQQFLQIASRSSRHIKQTSWHISSAILHYLIAQQLFEQIAPGTNGPPANSIEIGTVNELANDRHTVCLIDIDIIQHGPTIKAKSIANLNTLTGSSHC